MSWWPLEGNPGDFPTTLRFCVKATSRPAVAHQIRQQGGLAAASPLHQAVGTVGRGHWTQCRLLFNL